MPDPRISLRSVFCGLLLSSLFFTWARQLDLTSVAHLGFLIAIVVTAACIVVISVFARMTFLVGGMLACVVLCGLPPTYINAPGMLYGQRVFWTAVTTLSFTLPVAVTCGAIVHLLRKHQVERRSNLSRHDRCLNRVRKSNVPRDAAIIDPQSSPAPCP